MRSRLPPLNPLRAFEATARHSLVAKAAEELNVTASAVSHQLRVLETSLGVQLFIRAKGRLKLTPHGAAMLPAIRSAFQMIADAAAKIDYASMSGDLVVSAPVGITSRWLIRHIGDFMRQYPEINLKLVPSNEEKEIYSPQVDLCVRYGNGSWRDRRVSLLCSVALFPVSSPMLMNGPHPIRSVRDLRHHVLLCEDEGLEWRRWLLAASSSAAPEFRTSKLGNVHLSREARPRGGEARQIVRGDDPRRTRLLHHLPP